MTCQLGVMAQDTLIYIDGKTKIGTVHFTDGADELMFFKSNEDQSKDSPKTINVDDVFAVKYASGQTKVFYKFDEQNANLLRYNEMDKYVLGERYAWKHFHGRTSFVFGTAMGIAGPLILDFYGLATIPVAFFLVNAFPVKEPKFMNDANVKLDFLQDEYFKEGYKEIAKRKRQRNALWGGIVGAGSVFLYTYLIR